MKILQKRVLLSPARFVLLTALLISLIFAGIHCSIFDTLLGKKDLKVGIATRIVNPTQPAIPIGHSGRTAFDSCHVDLRVQAFVIEDQTKNRIVWLGWDFCNADRIAVDKVKERIFNEYDIPAENVCINASHTHSAPPLVKKSAMLPEFFDPQYAEFVLDQAVNVVGDAIKSLQKAELCYYSDSSDVAFNRRKIIDGEMSMKPNPSGVTDRSVQVITAISKDTKKEFALLIKYACHPVTVGPRGLGADYPGYLRLFVEKNHPNTTAMFLQGTGANTRIRVLNSDTTGWVDGTPERAKEFGLSISEGVERAVQKQGEPIVGPIIVNYAEIQLPIQDYPESRYREASANPKDVRVARWGKKYSDMLSRGEKNSNYLALSYSNLPIEDRISTNPFTLVALQGEVFL